MKRRERRAGPARGAPDPLAAALAAGALAEPQRLLGPHSATTGGEEGVVVRAFHPDAVACECLLAGSDALAMAAGEVPGLFSLSLPRLRPPFAYRLRFRFRDGNVWEREDPYRFASTLGEIDLHLFGEGTHRRIWEVLGAHPRRLDGVAGTSFAVWAPNAVRVAVVGDFCGWDGRLFPMCHRGGGVFELFVPDVGAGALYKFEIRTRAGLLRLKTDPFAFAMERPPATASRVCASSKAWGDGAWLEARRAKVWTREPLAVYEVHLGSWARAAEDGQRPLSYREIAPRLAAHVRRLGFTHVELLPIAEHPLDASWGYQVTGYYAPTARYGTPDEFRDFVDVCHQHGIGVILDWVPAHFPRDDFSLRRFDGTALYEHEDPRLGEHPDWGTLIFDYGRHEVRNFLVANALYWLREFHVDGLRVDAVASMLYRDYSRKPGEWVPNPLGGRENLEAVDFLRALNEAIREEHPDCFTVAEESTAWPGVTRPAAEGGLGFTFKWNMGWMHDTLRFLAREPVHRGFHLGDLTFAELYEQSERFLMPLSHDEVVHGKGSLLARMPGDLAQKLANLRLLLAYQWTRPGKKLLFMGTELAPSAEWSLAESLDWSLGEDPLRAGLARYLEALGRLYRDHPCLWRADPDPEGFAWIDCSDAENAVLSYRRRADADELVVVLNTTNVARSTYRIGAPRAGCWRETLCSDSADYGGSGLARPARVRAQPRPFHGLPQSIELVLPPLACLVLAPV